MGDFNHGLLWQINLEGRPGAYLFGTMHVRDARAFEWLPALTEKIISCKSFFAELDLGSSNLQSDIPVLPEGHRISHHISHKKWERLNRYCLKRYSFSLEGMDTMYPLIVLQQITVQHLNEEHQSILDMALYQIASENDLVCGGLEDWKEQLDLITSVPVKEQVKYLVDALQHHDAFVKQLKKLILDYQNQRIGALYQRTRKSLGPLRKSMLFQRNAIMAKRIRKLYLQESDSFYCVGAAHLSGEKGVLRLLKKEGFQLKNLPVL